MHFVTCCLIIGSASYIVREVRSVRERERERERETYREREREIDGSDVIIVALKLAMSLHVPMPKIRTIAVSSHFPLPKNRTFHFSLDTSCLTIVALKFTLSVAKRPLCSDSLLNGASRATSDRKPKTNDQILPSPIVLPIEKMNQINTKNYWKLKKRLCVRWLGVINLTWENLQIAKHKSVRWAERTPSWFVLCDL